MAFWNRQAPVEQANSGRSLLGYPVYCTEICFALIFLEKSKKITHTPNLTHKFVKIRQRDGSGTAKKIRKIVGQICLEVEL